MQIFKIPGTPAIIEDSIFKNKLNFPKRLTTLGDENYVLYIHEKIQRQKIKLKTLIRTVSIKYRCHNKLIKFIII